MLSYEQARKTVTEKVGQNIGPIATVELSVWAALGFVLAREIRADRDYPPFDRSTRDGYAVRAAEISAGARIRCAGEIKAGDELTTPLAPAECTQIMTGAAIPSGANAVVMIEHVHSEDHFIVFSRSAQPGQNIVPRASEGSAGQTLLAAGTRLGFAELSLAAQVGATKINCAKKPRVAILSTGDEIVSVDAVPGPFQIRNSNAVSLAAQVQLAGGEPIAIGNAVDRPEDLREKIKLGLRADVLVLSGGVSMGKYDLVESVLKEMGAQFFFDAVAIRPGKPAVFGVCQGKPVFGLPGNPVSTMVTFELFVTPAIDLLSGAQARPLPLVEVQLAEPMHEKPGMSHFLPARIEWNGPSTQVKPLRWQGSGDVTALTKANCFLVIPADREKIEAGDKVSVILRKDMI
jgi:molybdopterin molybdotransferase